MIGLFRISLIALIVPLMSLLSVKLAPRSNSLELLACLPDF